MRRLLFFSKSTDYLIVAYILLFFLCVVMLGRNFEEETVSRFFYGHVPYAWLSSVAYVLLGLLSAVILSGSTYLTRWLHTGTLSVSLILITISLISGYLWGRYSWGYVVLDFRIMSQLVLFMLSAMAILLSKSLKENVHVLLLIGLASIPAMKYSVDWWSTVHQSTTVSEYGNTICHSVLLLSVLISVFVCVLCADIIRMQVKNSWIEDRCT